MFRVLQDKLAAQSEKLVLSLAAWRTNTNE